MWDTEDKSWWCQDGVLREEDFVARIAPKLGLEAQINPAKDQDKFAPDLIVNGRLADLKCQTTPFFTARKAFRSEAHSSGIDPQFTVTFNRKDYARYTELYPDLDIYFWVEWSAETRYGVTILPMIGVYKVRFAEIARAIESEDVHLHDYLRRKNDTAGNARNSYGFDVRTFECLIQSIRAES